jgi:hypothetical protein
MNVQEFDNFVLSIHGEMGGHRKRNHQNSKLSPVLYLLSEEISVSNQKSKFDQKWKLIRGQSLEWFNLLAEQDLKKVDKADDKLDKFVTMLQVKYGYTRQQAADEINKRWAAFYMARRIAG